jgi:hypothetical protein
MYFNTGFLADLLERGKREREKREGEEGGEKIRVYQSVDENKGFTILALPKNVAIWNVTSD